ncbi:hypothetical protein [Curtobacterium sp. Curtsp57]|uniref:hypothetical protein n=1 Tax=Curtobacterium sp. Curtsp57 TaxID=3243047 RepID=UPI0039B47DA9
MTVIDVSNAPSVFASMAGLGDNGVRYGAGRNQPGKCTRWNWLALGAFHNTTGLPHAVAAWANAPAEHRHTLEQRPFRGAIASFGATDGPRWAGDENWMYGDVAMFTGVGLDSADWRDWELVGTDAAGVGVISTVTFGRRQVQTGGRRINGWQSSYGGAVLSPGGGAGAPITDTVTPTVPEEDDMSFKPLVAKTLIGKGPGTDTWLFDRNTKTYDHIRNANELALAAQLGAVVLDGPQPKDMFRGFRYTDVDGKGIR